MKARGVVLVVSLVILGIACNKDKDGTGPGPLAGVLKVVLTTPNSGSDGAAVVILTAPAVPTSVTAASGLDLWGGPVATAVDTIALTGTLSAGTILTLQVADVRKFADYSATLREVANSDATVALRDLTGYSLTVTQ